MPPKPQAACATADAATVTDDTVTSAPPTIPATLGAARQKPTFYLDTLYDWVQNSEIAMSHGASMMHHFHKELHEIMNEGSQETPEYIEAVQETYKTVMDGLMSAVHRRVPYYHVNRSAVPNGYHVIADEEEVEIRALLDDRVEEDEEDDDDFDGGKGGQSQSSGGSVTGAATAGSAGGSGVRNGKGGAHNGSGGGGGAGAKGGGPGGAGGGGQGSAGGGAAAAAGATSSSPPIDPKIKKREEARKRRLEEEKMLVELKQVRDDKGNVLGTVGPHPAPKLHYKAAKAGFSFPSRKSLSQRLNVDHAHNDDDEHFDFVPSTKGPSPDVDAVDHLTAFIRPLSADSLKKISESAKVKVSSTASSEESVDQIVKAAVRVGCEKACMLMDKYKIIDAVTDHAHAKHSSVSAMGPIGASVEFLKSLPDDLKEALGPVLGMPKDKNSVPEMWERIVAMGFLKVLANLRQRPLRKIVQELQLEIKETESTEKTCEAIVFSAFPNEQQRMKNAKLRQQGVIFSVVQTRSRTLGDMGFITFQVQNISCMQRDADRHYSPEFEFGGLKWSLLCMANKDSLALYLCQTGTVHCKFVISVLNNKNADEAICNEGTQKFSSSSAENDWGFNNVVKFEALLDPANNFWNPENDSISIEVGIVFVQPIPQPKQNAAAAAAAAAAVAANNQSQQQQQQQQQQRQQQQQQQHNDKRANGVKDHESADPHKQAQDAVLKKAAADKAAADKAAAAAEKAAVAEKIAAAEKAAAAQRAAVVDKKAAERRVKEEAEEEYRRQQQLLLEHERLEALRKRIRAELTKLQKEEERVRRESAQRALRTLQQSFEAFTNDKARIVREIKERERKEQAERQRELEKARQIQEHNAEMRQKVADLTAESAELDGKHEAAVEALQAAKDEHEENKAELARLEAEVSALQARHKKQQKVLAQRRAELAQAKKELSDSPKPGEMDGLLTGAEESELMKAMKMLVGIIE